MRSLGSCFRGPNDPPTGRPRRFASAARGVLAALFAFAAIAGATASADPDSNADAETAETLRALWAASSSDAAATQ